MAWRPRIPLSIAIAWACCACGGLGTAADAGPSVAERWEAAQAAWRRRDEGAWERWKSLPADTAQGREAHRRLAEADRHYREGIGRLSAGDGDAREELTDGVAIAPMDPSLYLPLARACRERGLEDRAAEYYLKFLAARPDAPEAREAHAELEELGRGLIGVFDPEVQGAATPEPEPESTSSVSLPIAVGAGLAVLAALALVAWARLGRGVSLAQLAERSPEQHPAIAYLVGSLRHELLKHRIGAVGDALAALARGDATADQIAFLENRLFGGEPLVEAWRGHLRAFDRALGFRLDPRRDPWFRRAGNAIAHIASLEGRLGVRDVRARRKLERAHATLREFDRHLSDLVGDLVRTRIDGELLREVVDEVRSEYRPGNVALDELRVDEPPEPVEVEVFRVDLVLVLKNVVRNAILAVDRAKPPRRVAVDVQVELEPTGEEIVRLRVRDTSQETLDTQVIHDRRVDRGLGLVTAALSRYDGAIDVEPGTDGWAKAVTLRFFRALDDDGLERSAA